jgi:hypothetical protein
LTAGGAVQRVEIGRERRIGVTGLVADQVERRRWRTAQAERRQADAAVADDDGGDARLTFIAMSGVFRSARSSGVDIDEAGRDDLAGGVDHGLAGLRRDRADGDDAVAAEADVGLERGAARAVDDLAVADDDLDVHGRHLRRQIRSAKQPHALKNITMKSMA